MRDISFGKQAKLPEQIGIDDQVWRAAVHEVTSLKLFIFKVIQNNLSNL